jgi:hypothetical protein
VTPDNGGGPTPSLVRHMMNPALLDQGVETYSQVITAVKSGQTTMTEAGPEVWMGEGNAAGHGGRLGVTNTFINSFWYLVSPISGLLIHTMTSTLSLTPER